MIAKLLHFSEEKVFLIPPMLPNLDVTDVFNYCHC